MTGQNCDYIYPISAVMSMTNLSARQIRYYESQGLVKPARSKGNQRLFTPVDVNDLLMIKDLLDKGLNIDGVKSVLSSGNPVEVASRTIFPDINLRSSPRQSFVQKLTSLYPVNNQEALNNLLIYKRNER
jgi:Predicted transcriptional regulators